MQRIHSLIDAIGPTSADMLIVGETGTGKEVLARTLHTASRAAMKKRQAKRR